MDGFLTTMLAVLLAESGGRTQLLAALTAARFQQDGAVLAGLLLAIVLNVALSAILGGLMHGWVSQDVLTFFYALACLFAGLTMLGSQQNVAGPVQKLGALLGSFLAVSLSMLQAPVAAEAPEIRAAVPAAAFVSEMGAPLQAAATEMLRQLKAGDAAASAPALLGLAGVRGPLFGGLPAATRLLRRAGAPRWGVFPGGCVDAACSVLLG